MEQLARPMKFWLLNTQSIGNKSAIVAECITSHDFRFFTAVRHDTIRMRVRISSCANRTATVEWRRLIVAPSRIPWMWKQTMAQCVFFSTSHAMPFVAFNCHRIDWWRWWLYTFMKYLRSYCSLWSIDQDLLQSARRFSMTLPMW